MYTNGNADLKILLYVPVAISPCLYSYMLLYHPENFGFLIAGILKLFTHEV